MLDLLKIELKKILPYRPLWIFLGLYVLLLPSVFSIFRNWKTSGVPLNLSAIYRFPDVWANLAYVASFFHIVPGFLIIMLMANEYSYKTLRQSVIYGYSRLDFLLAKVLLIVLISFLLTIILLIVGLFFGIDATADLQLSMLLEKIYVLPIFTLQAIGYMLLALLIVVLIKRSAVSIIIYFFYNIAIEPLVRFKLPASVKPYFPSQIFSDLLPFPEKGLIALSGIKLEEQPLYIIMAFSIAYIFLFIFISYYVLKKRDI